MKLNDFVTETLKKIIDGITDAQKYYSTKGGNVNPSGLTYRTNEGIQMWNYQTYQTAQMIDFDSAVTTAEGTETKGGIGVFVGPLGLGSQGKSDASNTSVSRIKFSVPIFLPKG